MKGTVRIEGTVTFGMIKLGFYTVSLYPNTGIVYENHGGKVVFKGPSRLGNNSAISVGSTGFVSFGEFFHATTTFRLATYHSITIGSHVLFGWECVVVDTDFHKLTSVDGGSRKEPYAPVVIGMNNWICMKTSILKGTKTPDNCVVGNNSVLNQDYGTEPYSLIIGNPAEKKYKGSFYDYKNDRVNYLKETVSDMLQSR